MSFTNKSTSLQSYGMLLYRTALHPEFFQIEARQRIEHGEYDFEAWIFQGGHALRFQHQGICVCEVVTDDQDALPDRGLVASLPCAGERDHEADFADRITFMTSVQTETLSDHLYLSTYNEMLDHGRSSDALQVAWPDHDHRGNNLSVIDMQRYQDQTHVQAYHLRADCGLVLRTQTIFQTKTK